MIRIDKYEAARNSSLTYEELGVNRVMYWAYVHAKETGSDVPEFCDEVNIKDVKSIASDCRESGIKKITVSRCTSRTAQVLWEFTKQGCAITGMRETADRNPAFVLKIRAVNVTIILMYICLLMVLLYPPKDANIASELRNGGTLKCRNLKEI